MLILSRVCAEFTDKSGAVIHKITPAMLGLFHDAPEALKGDLLFNMLLADGSIKTPEDAKKDRELEQDPMIGMAATGKTVDVEATKPAKAGKSAKTEEKPEIKNDKAEPEKTSK